MRWNKDHGSGVPHAFPQNAANGLQDRCIEILRVRLLGRRLAEVTQWLRAQPRAAGAAIGYFGASTGGGAALVAAAERPRDVNAVVSRGGRPDLAGDLLSRVQAPTLLIVGGHDEVVIELNQQAQRKMCCEVELEIVPGATHLFEEPGALDRVAKLASNWFLQHAHG